MQELPQTEYIAKKDSLLRSDELTYEELYTPEGLEKVRAIFRKLLEETAEEHGLIIPAEKMEFFVERVLLLRSKDEFLQLTLDNPTKLTLFAEKLLSLFSFEIAMAGGDGYRYYVHIGQSPLVSWQESLLHELKHIADRVVSGQLRIKYGDQVPLTGARAIEKDSNDWIMSVSLLVAVGVLVLLVGEEVFFEENVAAIHNGLIFFFGLSTLGTAGGLYLYAQNESEKRARAAEKRFERVNHISIAGKIKKMFLGGNS